MSPQGTALPRRVARPDEIIIGTGSGISQTTNLTSVTFNGRIPGTTAVGAGVNHSGYDMEYVVKSVLSDTKATMKKIKTKAFNKSSLSPEDPNSNRGYEQYNTTHLSKDGGSYLATMSTDAKADQFPGNVYSDLMQRVVDTKATNGGSDKIKHAIGTVTGGTGDFKLLAGGMYYAVWNTANGKIASVVTQNRDIA